MGGRVRLNTVGGKSKIEEEENEIDRDRRTQDWRRKEQEMGRGE